MATYNITLDTKKGQWVGTPVRLRAGDVDSCKVVATVTEGGEPQDLSGMKARFEAIKPDGTVVQDSDCSLSGSAITYLMNKNVAQAPGECAAAYFSILNGDGTVIDSTQSFVLVVEDGISAGSLSNDYIDSIEAVIALLEAQKRKYEQAEAARVAAESGRVSAESGRASAESGRVAAETARADAERLRASSEGERNAAESSRASEEAKRAQAESVRASAESARASAESKRAEAEKSRASAESERASSESSREQAEEARTSSESSRVSAERARSEAETARAAAESKRASAEKGRDSAEKLRSSEEAKRAQAESGRASAESARASAESRRAEAEASRVSAESARASAESSRSEAEKARAASQLKNDTDQAKNNADQKANNAAALGMTFVIVTEGQFDPSTLEPSFDGENGKMYLVPDPKGSGDNVYREWIWTGLWECIGSSATSFDAITTDTIDAIASGSSEAGTEGLSTTGLTYLWAKMKAAFSQIGHKHSKADITDFPSSMPASDVKAWAKAASKPSYTAAEVGAAAASHKHAMSDVNGLSAGMSALQPRSSYRTVTIQPGEWSENTVTKAVSGVRVASVVFCGAAPDSEVVASEAHVYCSAQADGTLTFTCVDPPKSAVTLNIEVKEA